MCRRWLNWGKKQFQELKELLQKVNEVIGRILKSKKLKKLKNFEFREVTEFFTYPSPVGVKYIRGCSPRDL